MSFRSGLKLVLVAAFAWSPLHALRVASLRAFGAVIERDVVMYHGYSVRHPRGLHLGADTSVGDRVTLDARGGLRIGRSVNISTDAQIWTAQHDWQAPGFDYVEAGVTIGDRVWIGPRVIVLPGTVIEDGVVLAAGAVARGHLSEWGLYGGVPARRIADRPRDVDYILGGPRRKPWFW